MAMVISNRLKRQPRVPVSGKTAQHCEMVRGDR